MSRVTRAASRAASRAEQLTPNEENLNASIDSKPAPASKSSNKKRTVLGEITANDVSQPGGSGNNGNKNAQAADGPKTKGRKGKKVGKKNDAVLDICHDSDDDEERHHSIVAGQLTSDPTSRDDQTPRETQGYGHSDGVGETLDGTADAQPDNATFFNLQAKKGELTPRHSSPALPAVSHTPKFDLALHQPVKEDKADKMDNDADEPNDSFVKSISSRTPRPSPITVESHDIDKNDNDDASDSFVDEIKTRSPAKSNNSPENPIDALDAFEDEIERITQDIPTVPNEALKSPAQDITKVNGIRPSAAVPKPSAKGPSKPRTKSPSKFAVRSTKPSRPTSFHVANTSHKMAVKRPLSSSGPSSRPTVASSSSSAATKPSNNSTRPSLAASTNTDKRTSISTRKPAFIPAKSSKQPTHPTFTLPSDAISARKKAEKEARLKAEQDELQRRRSFKARPVRVSSIQNSMPVKATASSQARASLARQDLSNTEDGSDGPGIRIARVSSSMSGNPLTVAKRTTASASASAANTKPTRSASSSTSSTSTNAARSRTSSLAHLPSKPGPVTKSTVTTADRMLQKARAREIARRDEVAKEEMEKEKRAKEEAAKQARALAAERGRAASREWAERQRMKRMEGAKGVGML